MEAQGKKGRKIEEEEKFEIFTPNRLPPMNARKKERMKKNSKLCDR